jgi:hypothetical protein
MAAASQSGDAHGNEIINQIQQAVEQMSSRDDHQRRDNQGQPGHLRPAKPNDYPAENRTDESAHEGKRE